MNPSHISSGRSLSPILSPTHKVPQKSPRSSLFSSPGAVTETALSPTPSYVKNFPFKAIFCDLDGTLLNSSKKISEKNVQILNEFIEGGVHVVIATGRSVEAIKNVTAELKLRTPMIALNGKEIRCHMGACTLDTSYLDDHLKESLFEYSKHLVSEYKVQNIYVAAESRSYILNNIVEHIDEYLKRDDGQLYPLDVHKPIDEKVVNYLFLFKNDEIKNDFVRDHKKLLHDDIRITTFNGWPWVEVGASHAHKGAALEFVCERLGITTDDVIAFGDGANDVEMLKCAGMGVAMGNADVHALEASDTQTIHHDDDGVAHFLSKVTLEEKEAVGSKKTLL